MQRLLNISTYPGEPEIFRNGWRRAERFLQQWEKKVKAPISALKS
jgi:hypothetical protein